MPTHNRADVVGLAIRSVLDQTISDFELLVVGDGCTDHTAGVVAAFADARIRWFDLPKAPGFGIANRNLALRQAQGEYIAFAPHDDLLFPDHLEKMLQLIERTDAEWCYSRPLWVSTDGVIVPFATNLHLADERRTFLEYGNSIPAICVVHRRSCFQTVGYWPEDVASAADWYLWRRIIQAGARIANLEEPTTLHFVANWKKSRDSLSPVVGHLLTIADSASWWPAILRTPVPQGQTEQSAMCEGIASNSNWYVDVRAACRLVIDRIFQDHTWNCHGIAPRIEAITAERDKAQREADSRGATITALVEERDKAQREAEVSRAIAAALRRRVDAMLQSHSWRITASLRAAKTVAYRFFRRQ